MKNMLLVALGGAAGSMLRYGVALLLKPAPGAGFPLATFSINLIGSFLIGALAGLATRGGWMENSGWLLLATGLCGGFTTFSAFSLENIRLLQSGAYGMALLYMSGSLLLGLTFCALGLRLVS